MKLLQRVAVVLILVLGLASVAFAQGAVAPQPPPPSFGEVFGRMIPMFVIVFFIFYFMVMKPQQARLKAQENLLGSLKRGDEVVTTGGLIGRVAGVEKGYIILEVAANTRVRIEPAHVVRKFEVTPEVLAADKAKAS